MYAMLYELQFRQEDDVEELEMKGTAA